MKNYSLRSMGEIQSGDGCFVISIDKVYASALKGLEGFSHIQVYWWADQLDKPELRKETIVEKPYVKGPVSLGLFATRSPLRPNPLCMTVVPVLSIDEKEGKVIVPYIDTEEGTPLLDIKPYYGMERVKEYKVPEWCSHWPKWYEDAGIFDWGAEFSKGVS